MMLLRRGRTGAEARPSCGRMPRFRPAVESLETRCLLSAATDTVLHPFLGAPGDGAQPEGSLTLVGNALYGRTFIGGNSNQGTLFRENPDGTGYTILHNFTYSLANGILDGAQPRHNALALSGTVLYGMTLAGGAKNTGILFSYDTAAPPLTAYQVLHTFQGGNKDGASPHGSVVLSGTTIYGMTSLGGTHNKGTLFQMNTDGTHFKVLFSFHKKTGYDPHGTPTFANGHLYGLTRQGGGSSGKDFGTLFDYKIGKNKLKVLHTFTGGTKDGATPFHGEVLVVGANLYGLTSAGGSTSTATDPGAGTIWRYGTKESSAPGFLVLHSFLGGTLDGKKPEGSLTLVGSTLYGMTSGGSSPGGTPDAGIIFQINPDGSGYAPVYPFAGPPKDGSHPVDSLIAVPGSGSSVSLCGLTQQGGINQVVGKGLTGYGVLFCLPLS
jgi:uncharacterized repeat protein (TIGR03803 family)